MDLREGLEQTLNRLMPKAQRFLIAVSGGADSVALVRLMAAGPFDIELGHLNHQLRDAADEDAAFVEALGERLNLPVHVQTLNVTVIARAKGWNLEDAGRRLRYAFFTRMAKARDLDAVLTAHTLNDQAETVLMQLVRGAAYLQGMPERRGRVLRPLLGVRRQDLCDYLTELDQTFREDASNLDTLYTRAWLRHEVLPLLEGPFPRVQAHLAKLATLQRDVRAHLSEEAKTYLQNSSLDLSRLQKAHPALQRQALADLLKTEYLPQDTRRIEALLSRLDSPHPVRLSLSPDKSARIAYGTLAVVKAVEADVPEVKVKRAEQLPEGVAAAALARYPELTLRARRAGDRIRLAGGTKKLSDLMIDAKVPREERDSLGVLASGKTVLWVEGLAIAEDVREELIDERLMRSALEQAQLAFGENELPVGAVVVKNDEIIAAAHNRTEALRDPSAHAEVLVLRKAAEKLGDWRLTNCTLYVTLEPCPMCFGALLQAHLPQIVYGAENRHEGALGGVADLLHHPWKRRMGVRRGVLANRCGSLLTQFFKMQRRDVGNT